MTSSDTLPLKRGPAGIAGHPARVSWAASFRLPRCGAALGDPGAGTAPSCTPAWPVSFGLTGLNHSRREFGGRGLSQVEASVVHSETRPCPVSGPAPGHHAGRRPCCFATGDPRGGGSDGLPLLGRRVGDRDGSRPAGEKRPLGARPGQRPAPNEHQGGWRLYGHRWYVPGRPRGPTAVVVPAVSRVRPRDVPGGSQVHWVATVSGQLGLDLTRRVCVTAFDEAPALLIGEGGGREPAALEQAERDFLIATRRPRARPRHSGGAWTRPSPTPRTASSSRRTIGAFQAVGAGVRRHPGGIPGWSRRRPGHAALRGRGPAAPRLRRRPTSAALRAGEAFRAVTESAVHLFGGNGLKPGSTTRTCTTAGPGPPKRLAGGPQAHRAAILRPRRLVAVGFRAAGAGAVLRSPSSRLPRRGIVLAASASRMDSEKPPKAHRQIAAAVQERDAVGGEGWPPLWPATR